MAYGNALIIATMPSATGSLTVDLEGYWERVYVQVNSMASSSALDVYVATEPSTTYYQLRKEVPNTTTVQAWSFVVAASAVANGGVIPIPNSFRYVKFIATDSAPSGAIGFKFICDSDN